jgi:hypothetical protein
VRRPLEARLTLTNTSAVPADWTSGYGCLAFLNVYDASGARVPVRGTDFGCLAVVTNRRVAPGESVTGRWELVARTTEGPALQPGTYVLEADPAIEAQVRFRRAVTIR